MYVYYTATTPAVHNRISRFGEWRRRGCRRRGDHLRLNNLSGATHNSGALAFGPDGKLCAAVEGTGTARTRSRSKTCSERCEINKNGTIPADNPFYTSATGKNRAIWALGLRNPFTFGFNPAGTELFINDVGQNTWEEINDGIMGRQLWLADDGRTHDRLGFRVRDTPTRMRTARSDAWAVPSTHPHESVPGRLFEHVLLRGLLRRLDP